MRGALAGVTAAAAWIAAEPVARRVFGTGSYGTARLLGAPLSRRHWRAVGLAAHLANGADVGLLFHRLGLSGSKACAVAAQLENVATWPAMAAADRLHPDRRSGVWPPLLRNGRVFAQEAAVHAVFGAVLGLFLPRRP